MNTNLPNEEGKEFAMQNKGFFSLLSAKENRVE